MIKRLLKIWFTITIYELIKYITNQLIIKVQANDDVEAPADFDIHDHIHLDNLKAEVSK